MSTCLDIETSLYKGDAVDSIRKFFIMGNWFHVPAYILSPDICKQMLTHKML